MYPIIQIDICGRMSSDSQQEAVYEQDQVLWAKIRGYPWWPAFVDKIHNYPKRGGETQYTVFFFGDNTHAKLGALKLRKFYEYYTECYSKAKNNKKLMTSIQLAEEKLEQNNQNVEIFEELRASMKLKHSRSADLKFISKSSDVQHSQQLFRDQVKQKSNIDHKKKDIEEEEEPQEEPVQESIEKIIKSNSLKKQNSNEKQKKATPKQKCGKAAARSPEKLNKQANKNNENSANDDNNHQAQPTSIRVTRKSKKPDPIFFQQPSQHPSEQSERQQEVVDEVKSESKAIEAEPQQSNQDEMESQSQVPVKQTRHQQKQNKREKKGKKRGRPKKIQVLSPESSNSQDQSRPKSENVPLKKKQIYKRPTYSQFHKQSNDQAQMSHEDQIIIERIKNLLNNRNELANYLEEISITESNVKEILDLRVSEILQEGPITPKIQYLLQILRAVLLHKYFPEDAKSKKKVIKMKKKKFIFQERNEQRREEQNKKEEENHITAEEQEIRKKTTIKLQKFLKPSQDVDTKAKDMAIKIERLIEQSDRSIGCLYRSLAYKVLSSLKTGKPSVVEIISQLQNNEFGR